MVSKSRACFTLLYVFLSLTTKLADAVAISPGVAWSWYRTMLKAHPLTTKSTTSSVIMTFSDVICQELTRGNQVVKDGEKADIDYLRVLHVAITGFVWSGPISHHWYATLEKIVKIKNPVGGLVARIVLDALIFSPLTVSGYFSVRSILEGSGVDGVQHKLTTRFVPTVVGAWKFWPAANVVNFGMVPVQFRVLYSNVLSLFWTGYLTHVNSKARLTMVSQKK